MIAISLNSYGQNYIATKDFSSIGNIYHTGGYLGIGTTSPVKHLHIADYLTSPTLRLQYTEAEKVNYIWDIKNNVDLNFSYGISPLTKMILTPLGQLALGTETSENSAILQLESTTMGLLGQTKKTI